MPLATLEAEGPRDPLAPRLMLAFLDRFHYIRIEGGTQVCLTFGGASVLDGEHAALLAGDVAHHFRELLHRGLHQPLGADLDGPGSSIEPGRRVATPRSEAEPSHAMEMQAPRAAGHADPAEGPQPPASPSWPEPDERSRRFSPEPPRPEPLSPSGEIPPRTRPLAGDEAIVEGRYKKVRPLGPGGLGRLYLARQLRLARDVALKEPGPGLYAQDALVAQEAARRFIRVGEIEGRLSHPNVAVVLDAGLHEDVPFLVTELLPGGSVRDLLQEHGVLSARLALKVIFQALHGLRHAHNRGILHGGLRPENILFDGAGNVRLTDFSMFKVAKPSGAAPRPALFSPGLLPYLAPELLGDPTRASQSADLYALGIVLYELLAGRLPGRRSPPPTELRADLPELVNLLFERLTRDEREARYATADEVLVDLYRNEALEWFLDPQEALFFLRSRQTDDFLDGLLDESTPQPGEGEPPGPGGGVVLSFHERAMRRSRPRPDRAGSLDTELEQEASDLLEQAFQNLVQNEDDLRMDEASPTAPAQDPDQGPAPSADIPPTDPKPDKHD